MQIHIYEGTEIMKRKLDLSLDFLYIFCIFTFYVNSVYFSIFQSSKCIKVHSLLTSNDIQLPETNDMHRRDKIFVLTPALDSSWPKFLRPSSLVAEKIPLDDLEFWERVSSAVLGLEVTFELSPMYLFGYCSSMFIFQANTVSTIPGFDRKNLYSLVCNEISQLFPTRLKFLLVSDVILLQDVQRIRELFMLLEFLVKKISSC